MTQKCHICKKESPIESVIAYRDLEGVLIIATAKEPELLQFTPGTPVTVCLGCSLKHVNGMIKIELEKLQELLTQS